MASDPNVQAPSVAQGFDCNWVLNAPQELVFKAWTEPARLSQWWGLRGYAMDIKKMDVRPRGVTHYRLSSPGGQETWCRMDYRTILAPEQLAFTTCFSDADGGRKRHPTNPQWPLEILYTVTLADFDGQTSLLIEMKPVGATDAELAAFQTAVGNPMNGTGETYGLLAEYLQQVQATE